MSIRCAIGSALLAALASMAQAAELPANLMVVGSPEFQTEAQYALQELLATPTGRGLLAAIGRTSHTMQIRETTDPGGYLDWDALHDADLEEDGTPGPGSDVWVEWNPSYEPRGLPRGVILGHELIHGLHGMRGELDIRTLNRPGHPDHREMLEEMRTVGTRGFDDRPFTENALRRDWNAVHGTSLPLRRTYSGDLLSGDPDHPLPETPAAPAPPATAPKRGARGLLNRLLGKGE